MIKTVGLILAMMWVLGAHAQALAPGAATPEAAAMTPDAERVRINAERSSLEAGFDLESAACHEKFLVSRCLEVVKLRRRDALADLRRQEITLNTFERKVKAAAQVKKTEEKSSPENQQQDAEKRAAALKDFQLRIEREKQKNAARGELQLKELGNSEAAAARIRGQQEKISERNSKQDAAAEQRRKFNERQEKAKERQAQHDRDQANQTRPSVSLPVPQ